MHVIVVGAGLCGLTTARELALSGIEVTVVEASERLGGRVESWHYADGVVAEARMEEFWTRSPAYPLLRELGLPLREDAPHSSAVIDGEIQVYSGDGDRETFLGGLFDDAERSAWRTWNDHAWQVCEQLAEVRSGAPLTADLDALRGISLAEHVTDLRLPRKVSEWIRIHVEPEAATRWNRIPALDGIEEARIFLDTPEGFGEVNGHVVGGNDRLVAALAASIPAGCIRTGSRVSYVADDGRRAVVVSHDRDDRPTRELADAVVLTVPIWELGRIRIEPALSSPAAEGMATLGHAHYAKLLMRLRPEAAEAWAVHGENLFTLLTDGPVGSVYLTDPADGRDLQMTLLLHARSAAAVRGMNERQTIGHCLRALDSYFVRDRTGREALLFGEISRQVTDVRAFQYPAAVATWPVDQGRSRFDPLADAVRMPHGRIHIGGDSTEGSHSEGAILSAQRIARAIIAHGPHGDVIPLQRAARRDAGLSRAR
jgi:monoamine oxidase